MDTNNQLDLYWEIRCDRGSNANGFSTKYHFGSFNKKEIDDIYIREVSLLKEQKEKAYYSRVIVERYSKIKDEWIYYDEDEEEEEEPEIITRIGHIEKMWLLIDDKGNYKEFIDEDL